MDVRRSAVNGRQSWPTGGSVGSWCPASSLLCDLLADRDHVLLGGEVLWVRTECLSPGMFLEKMRGEGIWNPKVCVLQMAQINISFYKLHFFPR